VRLRAQALVEDPETCVRETKQRLAEKAGLLSSEQRLIFYAPHERPADSLAACSDPGSAEELLLGSGRWEVR